MHMFTKYHGNPIQVTKNKNNMLNTRTPNTNQSVTFNPALRHEHHTIKFARPKRELKSLHQIAGGLFFWIRSGQARGTC